jgi:hypothetical protein
MTPPRATVPPVLYEVVDIEELKALLAPRRHDRPSAPLDRAA